MSSEKFDFGALVDDQMKGIRRGYKFGSAFNEDNLLPEKFRAILKKEMERLL